MICLRTWCAPTLVCVAACATEPSINSAVVVRDATSRVDVVLDPSGSIDWHETASAASPRLMRRRRELDAARAAVGSSGASSIMLDAEAFDGDDGLGGQVGLWFDPIAISGFGKVTLRRLVTEQRVLLAEARLAREAAAVREEVDVALESVDAMVTACEALDGLRHEAERGFARIDGIAAAGGLSASAHADATAARARIDAMCAVTRSQQASARTALAVACGIPADAPLLAQYLATTTVERLHAPDPRLEGSATLERVIAAHPDLDAPRFELAVAEAEYRLALRARWPDLRLGPAVAFQPDAALPGGLLAIDLPQPFAAESEIAAARQRREVAVEGLREAALARLADVRANENERTAARATEAAAARALDAAEKASLAATTRFLDDRRTHAAWWTALARHADAIVAYGDARIATARALARARRLLDPTEPPGAKP